MSDWRIDVKGQEALSRGLAQAEMAISPKGGLDGSIRRGAHVAFGIARGYTHIDTGYLKAGHQFKRVRASHWRVNINPALRNLRDNSNPAEYGVYEHARGGSHAFYERTYGRRDHIAKVVTNQIVKDLP